ncbi:nitrile hydratase accessory protein [Mycolicibacterium psychrotolerans]|uniref:Nitrile hydratase beta subunit-like N-terminal domain-containing protein n=1 Tax=Mycolicibacterium psychrotolerans TaxID=216929 RepID=A0A7I7M9E3_9MYCO|nr:nitrile hydratase accessory protein [Mycolicibacterium psychrotolerans]BBX68660.1 hypothetical protein MPSYJ_21210 [Mycolicibacterium psychrotolerans]
MTAPLDVDGPTAPPRRNGELVFEYPWEGRVFGLVLGLCEAGSFTWPQFREALIARLGQWQAQPAETSSFTYYDHWLAALTDVLAAEGVLSEGDIAERAAALAQRPAGHDHRH